MKNNLFFFGEGGGGGSLCYSYGLDYGPTFSSFYTCLNSCYIHCSKYCLESDGKPAILFSTLLTRAENKGYKILLLEHRKNKASKIEVILS